MSKGSDELLRIVKSIFGEQTVVISEHVLPGNLRLDFYIPSMNLAFEFHGRQHDHFVKHFHDSKASFEDSKWRDEQKSLLCHKKGIMLVTFWYNEDLTFDSVKDRISEVVRNWEPYPYTPPEDPRAEEKARAKSDSLDRAREARRLTYERAKAFKNKTRTRD